MDEIKKVDLDRVSKLKEETIDLNKEQIAKKAAEQKRLEDETTNKIAQEIIDSLQRLDSRS